MDYARLVTDNGLHIAGLSKRFGDTQAVSDLSLRVPPGNLIGFLGPNGAGKTTTMRSIMGMVRPDSGTIEWNGASVGDDERRRFGYMPQERGLYARMKVAEQVNYFGRLAGLSADTASERTDYWLDRVGLTERRDSLVQELSGGNQQRVQLAVSLVHDPNVLVLDEPFAGLDPVAAETMRLIIAERAEAGASVLFSSHQLDLVEGLCEEVVIVASGEVVAQGEVTDLRSASPIRLLKVHWSDPHPEWNPLTGAIRTRNDHEVVVELDAAADPGTHLAHALAAGHVAEISLEPPGLDEVFADVIAEQHAHQTESGAGAKEVTA